MERKSEKSKRAWDFRVGKYTTYTRIEIPENNLKEIMTTNQFCVKSDYKRFLRDIKHVNNHERKVGKMGTSRS